MANFYGEYPFIGSGGVTSLNGETGDLTLVAGTGISITTPTSTTIQISSTSSGDVTLAAFGSSPNANAATLTGQVLNLEPASASFPGGVSTGTQSFAGNKTFTGAIAASNFSGSSSGANTGDITLTAVGVSANANAATLTGQILSLQPFSSAFPGVVTASGGGTANFLRADGGWAAPPGTATPGGSNTQVQFNDSGAFGGDAGLVYNKTTNALSVVSGSISVAGTGTNSQAFGPNTIASNTNNTAVGDTATALGGQDNTAIGYSAQAGQSGQTSNQSMTVVGSQSIASSNTATGGSLFGSGMTATGQYTTRLGGQGGNSSGDRQISVGWSNSLSSFSDCILLAGLSGAVTAASQFVVGSETSPITAMFIGEGVTSTTPGSLSINGSGGSGSNIASGSLTLNPGKSTGNATPGDVRVQATTVGSSGSTAQTLSEIARFNITGLGLGNIAPGQMLDVNGNARIRGLTTAGAVTTDSSGNLSSAAALGVTSGGTGTSTAFTTGSVVFAGASGVYTQDNANFFWDDTNNRLGLGTAAPSAVLDVSSTTTQNAIFAHSIRTDLRVGGVVSVPTTVFTTNNSFVNTAIQTELRSIVSTGVTQSGSQAGALLSVGRNLNVNGDTGTVTNLIGVQNTYGHFNNDVTATPATTNVYGQLFSPNRRGTGTITNFYDLYIDEDTGATVTPTNRWSFYNNSTGDSYIRGNLGIGVTTPATQLHTSGGVRFANFGAGIATFSSTGVVSSTATTGSGSVVLATSPTITTPTLTNPTIAAIANLTTNGYVKTSGGIGTLSAQAVPIPIADGGTNGTATPTSGAVPYGTGTAYAFTATSDMFWDQTNKRLNLGSASTTAQIGATSSTESIVGRFQATGTNVTQSGIRTDVTGTASSNGTYTLNGWNFSGQYVVNAGITNSGSVNGISVTNLRNFATSNDNGTLTSQSGVTISYGSTNSDVTATPQITTAKAINISPNYRTGTIGTMYDIFLASDSTGGTATTRYGVFQQNTANNSFAGNIAVGLATPAAKLHVDAGTATASALKFTAGSTTGQTSTDGVDFGIDTSGNGEIRQRENLPLIIYTNNTERARVLSTGELGVGTTTPGSTFQVSGSQAGTVTARTTNLTLDATHYFVTVDATAGAVTITFPDAVAGILGRVYHIKKIDSSANAVNIARTGSDDTFDGATSDSITVQWQSNSYIAASTTLWAKF